MGLKRVRRRLPKRDDSESDRSGTTNKERQTADKERQTTGRNGEQESAQGTATVARARSDGGQTTTGDVSYDSGPDAAALQERHGIEIERREAKRLQRLENEFGTDRVQRWADEGMPVEVMGKPRDMEAFRAKEESQGDSAPGSGRSKGGSASAGASESAGQSASNSQGSDTQVTESVQKVVSSSGQSLDDSVQREMETKMGGDFSDVQVHTGSEAAAAAESINARAFTVGNNVAFNEGEYQPATESGKKVLAHELTHVRQQTNGRVSLLSDAALPPQGLHVQPKLEVSSPNDPAEKEARQVAERVVAMDTPAEPTAAGGETARQVSGEQVQRGIFSDAASAVSDAASAVGDAVGSAIESAGQAVDAIAESASNLGEKAWSLLESGGKKVWNKLKSKGEALVNMVREGGERAWNVLKQGGKQAWEVVKSNGKQVWDVLKSGGEQLWSMLEENTEFLLNMVKQGGKQAMSILQRAGQRAWQVLQTVGGPVWSALKKAGKQLWELLQRNKQLLLSMLQKAGGMAWQILKSGGQQLWSVLQTVGSQAWRVLQNTGGRLWELLKTNKNILVNIIQRTGQQAWAIVKQGANRLWPILRQCGSRVWNILLQTGQRLADLVRSDPNFLKNMIQNGGSRIFGILANSGKQLWNVISSYGPSIWNVLKDTGERLWDLLGRSRDLLLNVLRNGGQQAWSILSSGGQRLYAILQRAGSQAWSVLVSTGNRLWELFEKNRPFLVSVIRQGIQQVWSVINRNAQRFWSLLESTGQAVVNALQAAKQRFSKFLQRGLERFRNFLRTLGESALAFIEQFGQKLEKYFITYPKKVIGMLQQFVSNTATFANWLWEGLKQLISDPSGMEEWLASGAAGAGTPARMLGAIVDMLPAAEAWAWISTVFRDGRPPSGGEVSAVDPVIGDAVTYPSVRIVEDSSFSGRAFVTGHVINLPGGAGNTKTLVHEFGHVGQYEAVGSRYIPEAIHAQNSAMGYDYTLEALRNNPFSSFNREQQASILGDLHGHVNNDASGDSNLQVENPISVDGEEISSSGAYFDRYEEIHADGEKPYERHRDQFQAGRV